MEKKASICGPLTIAVDVTYRCTLRCLHCFNCSGEQSYDDELSDSELLQVCRQITDVLPNVVCFCGGEPLIRKDILIKCCELLKTSSNGMIKVNMVTNGELMSKEVASDLFKVGFDTIQVSLDGADADTHDWLRNKKGAFEKAVNAIKYLNEAGFSVGVACTPTLKNINNVEGIL